MVFEYIESWGSHSSDKGGASDILNATAFAVGLRSEDDGEIITPMIARLKIDAKVIVTDHATVSSGKIRTELASGEITKKAAKMLDQGIIDYCQEAKLYGL